MRVRKLATWPAFLALVWLSLVAAAALPRQSPDFTILDPAGKQTKLSSFKGDVVVIEFLLTHCPHCWRLADTVGKLYKELGPRGFRAVAVAFDNNISGPVVADFVGRSKLLFPVGYTTADRVDSFLGRDASERFQVPQIVVVDRAGVIRAQSRPTGESKLEDEKYLRNLLDSLLKEGPPAGTTKPPS
jgi:peroxiredoxin